MIKMHCFSWYSGSVHCHLTQIWNYSQRNTVDLGDSEWPNWRRRMTKSEEEGLLTIVTTFVSEIYFSMWFLESSCVDDSEYVPNLPAAMNIFFTTSVQSENLTFLGVRSTNPLPGASGLVKLTTPPAASTGTASQLAASKIFGIFQSHVGAWNRWICVETETAELKTKVKGKGGVGRRNTKQRKRSRGKRSRFKIHLFGNIQLLWRKMCMRPYILTRSLTSFFFVAFQLLFSYPTQIYWSAQKWPFKAIV